MIAITGPRTAAEMFNRGIGDAPIAAPVTPVSETMNQEGDEHQ